MIKLDEYDVYRYYLALRLHFTNDKYDIIKTQGRLKTNRTAFLKRTAIHAACRRLAHRLNEKDVVNFFVSNLVAGDNYGGAFDSCSEKVYKEWQRRIESLSYIFEEDLAKLRDMCEKQNKDFSYIFEYDEENTHPLLLRAYLAGDITIETLVILNQLHSYIDKFDSKMYNDVVWNKVSRLIKKYRPFLRYDKKRINDAYTRFQ